MPGVRLGRGAPTFDPLSLSCGAVLHFKRYSPEADHGATRAAQRYMQSITPEGEQWATADWDVAYHIALAKALVESWDNVYGSGDDPMPVTPENIELLLREAPGASVEFRIFYNTAVYKWNREGEFLGTLPNGTTVEVPLTATDAEA